jgi:hypothetical protein
MALSFRELQRDQAVKLPLRRGRPATSDAPSSSSRCRCRPLRLESEVVQVRHLPRVHPIDVRVLTDDVFGDT